MPAPFSPVVPVGPVRATRCKALIVQPHSVRFTVSRLPLLLLYLTKCNYTKVRGLVNDNVLLEISILYDLCLLCQFVCLHHARCLVDDRRVVCQRNIFDQDYSCVRLCHIISFERRHDFLRRLAKLGAIDICSKSHVAPGLSVCNIRCQAGLINRVHRQIRAGGRQGNVCRVAGH